MSLTLLQALQAGVEYSNSNLFEKVLTDHGLSGSTTYTSAYEEAVDLCLADIYMHLAVHPELREGSWATSMNSEELLKARRLLYQKHGLVPPEEENAVSGVPLVDGTAQW